MNNEQLKAQNKELAASILRGNHALESLALASIDSLERVAHMHNACLNLAIVDGDYNKAEEVDILMKQGIKDVMGSLRAIAETAAPHHSVVVQ